MKRILATFLCLLTLAGLAGCSALPAGNSAARATILQNGYVNEERNRLLKEDIAYFASELPKRHKNPFTKLSKEEFQKQTAALIADIDHLPNAQVFARLAQIMASIGDAHTCLNFWDGYNYPLQFYIFDKDVYIVNTEKGMEDLLYQKVTAVNGIPAAEVLSLLSTIISHENESWLQNALAKYLASPVYLVGLGIVSDEESATFTIESDGATKEITVPVRYSYQTPVDFCNDTADDVVLGGFSGNYSYEYLTDANTLYFSYNLCEGKQEFREFNGRMFEDIANQDVEKIVLDLRRNPGGNSEVLNPFTEKLKVYKEEHPAVRVFILTGRATFSSGMFAIYRTMEAVPDAISVGEPTGGALDCFGDIKTFTLPNSQIPIQYSTKYFTFTKTFSYKNKGTDTFIPDVPLSPTIEDYKTGNDVVLNYALSYGE